MSRNLDRAREAMRRWRARDRERDRAAKRADYARRSVAVRAANARYAREHPQVARTKRHRRRALLVSASGRFTTAEWIALVGLYDGKCAYCGGNGPLKIEHRIPLSRGGTNSIDNILPACRNCNTRKHRLTDDEFRQRLGRDV